MDNMHEALCNYFCWILSFNGASRLLWLSLLWLVFETITRLIVRNNGTSKRAYHSAQIKDYGSWWLITIGSIFILAMIILVLHIQWEADLPSYLIPIGIGMMLIGTALRIWAVITLGEFFTMHVVIFPHHTLIDKGPYHWIRHPSYTGVLITAIGLGLATSYLLVLISFLVILGISLGYRIYIEEKALQEQFGKRWSDYAARTWKLIPWVW